MLLANIPTDCLHLGQRCTGFEPTGDDVTASFGDAQANARCLLGADGLWSVVRAGLLGEQKPRYAGYACYRGLVDYDPSWFPEGWFIQSIGQGARFGIVHTGSGQVYWWATVNAPEGTSAPPRGRKQVLLQTYGAWARPVPQAIEATPDDAILLNDIVDRPPTDTWGRGPVSLMGDAAHPMTPNMAQGACQAIEDGVVLAKHLADTSEHIPVEGRLRAYEMARRERTAAVTQASWFIGARGQGLLSPEEAGRAMQLADRERLLTFEP